MAIWYVKLDFRSARHRNLLGLVPVTKKHGADIKLGKTLQWNLDYLRWAWEGYLLGTSCSSRIYHRRKSYITILSPSSNSGIELKNHNALFCENR